MVLTIRGAFLRYPRARFRQYSEAEKEESHYMTTISTVKRRRRIQPSSATVAIFLLLGGVGMTQEQRASSAAALKNPVAATPQSIGAGKKSYDANCAACHGNMAQGAVKAGVLISI